jgi:N-hydroxyarylamine O-acetyltransferase
MESGSENGNSNVVELLDDDLLSRVLGKMSVSRPTLDLAGLSEIYAAWCRSIPFDNIRKMIALREPASPMPGLDAADFCESWIEHGTGGTCWPSSNALFVLLRSLGFDARRVAGSMYNRPDPNHGTVKVCVDGQDWLVDSSMLTYRPLPLNGEIYVHDDPAHGVEIEPSNGSHIVWRDFTGSSDYIPCHLLFDTVDTNFYFDRYERFSREVSPFNSKLHFHKGGPDGGYVIIGNRRFRRASGELEITEFTADELCDLLRLEAGVSAVMVNRWVASGSLESTFQPSEFTPPEMPVVRPSLR